MTGWEEGAEVLYKNWGSGAGGGIEEFGFDFRRD